MHPLPTLRYAACLGLATLLAACAPSRLQPTVAAPDATALAQAAPALLLNRLSWGNNPASARQLQALGLQHYLQQQLTPGSAVLPAPVQAQIDAMTISRQPLETLMRELEARRLVAEQQKGTDDSLRKEYQQELTRLAREAASRALLRDLYATNQLQEQMVWFWMNHFNIHSGKHNVRAMLGDFEEQAIRPQALGNFRELLRATALHPAMLRYLDNEHNAVNRINENYARELLELHTMGVDGGYSQRDVQELARVLTGVGINHGGDTPRLRPEWQRLYLRRGLFEFNPQRHDFGSKQVLGSTLQGRGLPELDQVLTLLCRQPATARFISRKLAVYFVSDTPSEALVQRMATAFLRSDGDIAQVLRSMLQTEEFAASLGGKFKDPLHYALAALRLAYDGATIVNTGPLLNWLNQMGQQPNGHQTPDGYAMQESAWASPGQMAARFDIARLIAAGSPALFRPDLAAMPAQPSPAPALASSAFVQHWSLSFSPATRHTLQQAASAQEWNALFLAAPEMMRR